MKHERAVRAAIVGSGLVIATCMFGIAWVDRRTYPLLFVACTAFAGVAYVAVLLLVNRFEGKSYRLLYVCLALAAGWRIPLLLKPPTLSTDVYRYVWDGRIQRLGYNPYIVVPADPSFRQLHTAETLLMNHRSEPTPYPAAAELFFRAVATVHESARAMKSAIFLCDVTLAGVLFAWLIGSHRNPWLVLAYAWNPLVAIEGAGNGHLDLVGALCLVLAAISLGRGKRTLSAVAFSLAVGVKFLPATLAPLLLGRIRIRDAALGGGILVAMYIPFLGDSKLPVGSLGDYLTNWRYNAPIFSALERVFPTAVLVAVPVILGVVVAFWSRWNLPVDSPETWAWPATATLLFAPTIYPWYLLWLTPFLFTARVLPLAVWTVSSLAFYWPVPVWATTLIEYGSAAGVAGLMLAKSLRARRAAIASE